MQVLFSIFPHGLVRVRSAPPDAVFAFLDTRTLDPSLSPFLGGASVVSGLPSEDILFLFSEFGAPHLRFSSLFLYVSSYVLESSSPGPPFP